MSGKDSEKIKEILNKFGCDPPPEDLFEICKNISDLSSVIKSFEQRKKKPPPDK